MPASMHPTLRKLQEGDRRSIGRSNEVVFEVLSKPRLFRVVFSGMSAEDPLIRMRSADAVDKITALLPSVRRRLAELTVTGTPAMKARGRKLLGALSARAARSAATGRKRRAHERRT